jgi:hypothetical protein
MMQGQQNKKNFKMYFCTVKTNFHPGQRLLPHKIGPAHTNIQYTIMARLDTLTRQQWCMIARQLRKYADRLMELRCRLFC